MNEIIIPFTRGGKQFEARISKNSCTIVEINPDSDTGLQYVGKVSEITIRTAVGGIQTILVKMEMGILTPGGVVVEKNTVSWSFFSSHPDMAFFEDNFGQGFMTNCVNGFTKHFMPTNARYRHLESSFSGVTDDLGAKIIENDD